MKLTAYVRTSRGGNGGGDSLDAQEEACHEWAAGHGHEVVSVWRDDGVSGGVPADERPGLLAAITEVEESVADGVVVHRLDRLARELHVQEAALARLWAVGDHVSVFEAVEGEVLRDDPDDPHRRFLRQVLGAAAELERGLIRARLRRGRKRKRDRGGYIGGPTVPFGWRVEGGALIEHEEEQALIADIIALRDGSPPRTWQQVADAIGGRLHPNGVKKVYRRATGRTGGRVHRAA